MTEVYSPPDPRFSAEAQVNVAERLIKACAGCHLELSEPDATYLAAVVTRQGAIPREFDAACLSAWRSGQETAGRGLAERLRERANGAGHLIRHPGQTRLCSDPAHDDRWCSTCAVMEAGMCLAADLIEQWAGDDG